MGGGTQAINDAYGLYVPNWVPEPTRRYLAHTELGLSIRSIARIAGCHPSTVLRQIRRLEAQRDDPLLDRALMDLIQMRPAGLKATGTCRKSSVSETNMTPYTSQANDELTTEELQSGAIPVLRKLVQPGALLAIADAMDKAVVVREDQDGQTLRTAIVDCRVAQAMILHDWIFCEKPGRISRYRISSEGRAALGRMIAGNESRAQISKHGFEDVQSGFDFEAARGGTRRSRYSAVDSPLTSLGKRVGKNGKPFLDPALVAAGERLREDYELARIEDGGRILDLRDWSSIGKIPRGSRQSDARNRVLEALTELGPGLADVVLRCCCQLEGLETAEKKLGWSARSGKVVLRIALQQLARFYDGKGNCEEMIG